MLDLSGFQVLFILFSLLWSVTVCWLGILFSLTKGPVGKDTSCRWIIDDAPLFSVCVLWFYVLWFKGPKQCIYWNLIAGVKSAQRTICVLRFLYPNPEISACLEKAKCNMTFTLNNPRERGGGGDLHLNLQEAYFLPTTKADSCINHSDSQETEGRPGHPSYSQTRRSGYTVPTTASRQEQGWQRGTKAMTLETLDFPLLRDRGSCQKICSNRSIPLGEEIVNGGPHMRGGSFQWEPFLPRCASDWPGYLHRKWAQEVSVYKPFILKAIAAAAFYCLPKQ